MPDMESDDKNSRVSNIDISNLSQDKKLSNLLNVVVNEVKLYAEDQLTRIRQLSNIGMALSVEKDIKSLLEMIVDEARALSNADAGTLYTIDNDNQSLKFEILQNNSLNIRMGGTSGIKIKLPNVPLYVNDVKNYTNVSSYVALTGQPVNIPDVYMADDFNLTGTRKYDESTGYRSKSMLVMPLKNHESNIIGVLQLLNAQDFDTGEVIEFSIEYEDLIASLASQAAVALTNVQLIQDLKNLFYSFIKSIATAIDEKSPYTGGHINRVVDLTMLIAETINNSTKGKFKDIVFNDDEMEELRIAAWMHDVGKVTTPEYIVDKATKLETVFDRIELVATRFHFIETLIENKYLKKKIDILQNSAASNEEIENIDKAIEKDIHELRQDLEFIQSCNNTGDFMSDEKVDRMQEIAEKTYNINDEQFHYLTDDETNNLCIRKGTLLEREREVIENHATMTLKITEQLPFPEKLKKVPEFASSHHEKLDGTGYPQGLPDKQLSWQSRIMAIADIFEALTAKDRPYKEPMKLSQAIRILGFMKKDNHIDPDIYDLFLESGIYKKYAEKELTKEQIDL